MDTMQSEKLGMMNILPLINKPKQILDMLKERYIVQIIKTKDKDKRNELARSSRINSHGARCVLW
jgi:hypothetical protein